MRLIAAALLLALAACAAETLEIFGQKWTVPVAADWKVETSDGVPSLRLLVARPMTSPRRPVQFALAETPDLLDGDGDGALCDTDCDDAEARARPGLAEVGCDGIDNDCDGGTPDVLDGDADGFTCDVDCEIGRAHV